MGRNRIQEKLRLLSIPWRALESPAWSYFLQAVSDPDTLHQRSDGNSNYQFLPSFCCASYYLRDEPHLLPLTLQVNYFLLLHQNPGHFICESEKNHACHYRITLLYNDFPRLQGDFRLKNLNCDGFR
jgi:hypothetical protein